MMYVSTPLFGSSNAQLSPRERELLQTIRPGRDNRAAICEIHAIRLSDEIFPDNNRAAELLIKRVMAAAACGNALSDEEKRELASYDCPSWSQIMSIAEQAMLTARPEIRNQLSMVVANYEQIRPLTGGTPSHDELRAACDTFSKYCDTVCKVFTTREAAQAHADFHREPSTLERYFLRCLPQDLEIWDITESSSQFSSGDSFRCTADLTRTRGFLLGIREAISALESSLGTIHVVDAGCGSFPIMAIYAALCSPKVSATCLETNPLSAALAQRVISALGLSRQIEVTQCDATTFRPARTIDLLISETMDSCLQSEPIVGIMANLCLHLSQHARVLPSQVEIAVALVPEDILLSPPRYRVRAGEVAPDYNIEWLDTTRYVSSTGCPDMTIDLQVDLANRPHGTYGVVVGSRVSVGSQTIEFQESLITRLSTVGILDASRGRVLEKIEVDPTTERLLVKYQAGQSTKFAGSLIRSPLKIPRITR